MSKTVNIIILHVIVVVQLIVVAMSTTEVV